MAQYGSLAVQLGRARQFFRAIVPLASGLMIISISLMGISLPRAVRPTTMDVDEQRQGGMAAAPIVRQQLAYICGGA